MDDKQLYKLMEDYLNTSLKGDKDRDLSKFNKVELKRKTSFFKSKLFYAALSCVMILVISFSVLLPFLFKNKNGGTEIRYYDDIKMISS